MTSISRVILIVLVLLGPGIGAAGAQAPASPEVTEQQGEFVPAESLPQREQVPAAPLLIGAYAFVMLALFAYVVSVSRRVGAVKADIARLESEIRRSSRA